MRSFIQGNTAFLGSISAIIAVFCFSINDVVIKFLSGDYALHLVILVRSLVGLIVLFLIIVPFSGGLQSLHTNRLGLHFSKRLLCGLCKYNIFFGFSRITTG